jgi:hypothetical protein
MRGRPAQTGVLTTLPVSRNFFRMYRIDYSLIPVLLTTETFSKDICKATTSFRSLGMRRLIVVLT